MLNCFLNNATSMDQTFVDLVIETLIPNHKPDILEAYYAVI